MESVRINNVCFQSHVRTCNADHGDYITLLRRLRALPGVKKVFIRSGIRFDYVLADKKDHFLEELCKYHVSGQLKVAPEHICDSVLRLMGKPSNHVYEQFAKEYRNMNKSWEKAVYGSVFNVFPSGISFKEAIALAEYIRDLGYMPEQVQDFYPTPSTVSTCMYYTGYDCRTMEQVYVPTNPMKKPCSGR